MPKDRIKELFHNTEPKLEKVWNKFTGNTSKWEERIGPDGKSIPHICIKVPTGGGKTRIASAILKDIRKKNGLVLWMVPNTALIEQTLNILKDKTHPIRQMLDFVSNNRVEIIKKDERLSKEMLKANLCIMPLTQQSTNRAVNKDFLKMKRNNSIYSEFFPDSDDNEKIDRLVNEHPGLDVIEGTNIPVKSLANVLKMEKPVIILDESHKAASNNFGIWAEHVNRLGPRLIIELSATPNEEKSNILRVVSGKELQQEEMIKKK